MSFKHKDGSIAGLARREQQHRQRVLLALAALLLLSVSPVLGHHLIGAVPWLPATREHLWIFCLVAIHHMLAPVHEFFHLLLYCGLAFALFDRVRAVFRHRRVMGALPVKRPSAHSPVTAAARRIGLHASRIRLVEGLPNPAFTSGWFRPLVFVASDLSDRLRADELEAVLAHEAAHVRRRDPLRLFVLRTVSKVLFWLPAIARLADDLADEWEIAADDEAARTHALPLASAILRMSGAPAQPLDPAVGFQNADLFTRRVRRLAGEDAVVGTHVSRRAIGLAAAALATVWISGVIVLHPLSPTGVGTTPAHCSHHTGLSIQHIFCRGLSSALMHDECPHNAERSASPSSWTG